MFNKRNTNFLRSASVATLAMSLAPGIAFAQISAADVWQNTTAVYNAFGISTTADISANANITTYNNVRYDITLPFGVANFNVTSPSFAMIENNDGTVSIQYPTSYQAGISGRAIETGSFSAKVNIETAGLAMVASGEPGDITYTYSIDSFAISLQDISVSDPDAQADLEGMEAELSMEFGDNQTVTQIVEGSLITMDTTQRHETITMNLRMVMPDGNVLDQTDILRLSEGRSSIAMPTEGVNILNLAPAFAQGMSFSSQTTLASQESQQTVNSEIGIEISSQKTVTGPQIISARLDQNGFDLSLLVEGIAGLVNDQLIPDPIEIELTSMHTRIAFPISASAAPQDFVYNVGVEGIQVSDALWNLIDPANQMERSPANFVFDSSGSVLLMADLANFTAMKTIVDNNMLFGELRSFQLDRFDLGALGATATATAAFTFDNSDMVSFDGLPKPTGDASFTITGLDAAMDQLAAVDLLSPDDIFGARMGMMMIANATGNDQLEGTFRIDEEGGVFANGMQLR